MHVTQKGHTNCIDILKDELARAITHHKSKSRDLDRKEAQKFKEDIRTTEIV